MADSVTCDQCGKVAAKSLTSNWHTVAQRVEPANASIAFYGRISGDYCTLDCLIKAAKVRRRADRESRARFDQGISLSGTAMHNHFTTA